ncbi:MAG TPA: HyaD/HybD family hydrogenase maturation endopeptidase [Bryobacteraceae bacterium]|nr:HyaD/HybD family hydrogenase maturation endopeptidase [Bryobacteraceae bacterium]
MSILILGLGNLVHADDGLGVHAIHLLQQDPRVPPDVTLLDGGTQGLSLIPHISGFKRVLVIDAVDVGEAPGTLLRLEGKSLDNLPGKATVHALGFADLMIALKLLGDSPDEVVLIGVQPQSVSDWSPELTPPIAAALEKIPDLVLSQIEAWKGAACAC